MKYIEKSTNELLQQPIKKKNLILTNHNSQIIFRDGIVDEINT